MTNDISTKLVYIPTIPKHGFSNLIEEFWRKRPNHRLHMELSTSGTFIFDSQEDRQIFEQILDDRRINYHNQVIEEEKQPLPHEATYSGGTFNNAVSMVGFIGNYQSVDEVIASDSVELQELGGSFEEIADRMKDIVDFAKSIHNFPVQYDDNIIIERYGLTRGFQVCPFGCKSITWNDDAFLKNQATNQKLVINRGTEHLARNHHLLEKGNQYGITTAEFYEHFMP